MSSEQTPPGVLADEEADGDLSPTEDRRPNRVKGKRHG